MGRGGAGLIAAVLALAGCKSTDPKPTDKDPVGTAASRAKGDDGKVPAWLEPVGQFTASDSGDVRNATTGQDGVGGRVLDPFNRPIGNVYIQVEAVNPPPGSRAAVGIYTDQNGGFSTYGLKAGKPYNLTVETTLDGRQYTASVQTLVPNPNITLMLRDDLGLPPVGILKGPATGTFPPHPTPTDAGSDRIPPPPVGFAPPTPKPADGAWAPGAEATRSVPTTIAPVTPKPTPSPAGTIPPPADLTPTSPPLRPENVADGPKPWAPPTATIPSPPLPPSYPNPTTPPPPPPDPTNMKMGMSGTGGGFILVDTLERNWEFPANKSGSVVMIEFMTTTCAYSKGVIPVIADFQSRYGSSGLQVIAVACDNLPQKQRAAASGKYARDNNLNYAIFVEPGDEAGTVRNRYNVMGYPTVVLLDATGAVLWQGHPNKRAELEAAIKRALGK